jgi:hypothetical protein
MTRFFTTLLAGLAAATFAHSACAVAIWDEGADGDLSNDPEAPTVLALGLGSNTVTGSSQLGDMDVFTITVPDGASFVQLLLTSFDSADDLGFLALQSGPAITDITSPANMLGWVHPSAAFVGTDLLDDLALGQGALGFTPPLGSGTYTLWMQQTGSELIGYAFDLNVVADPTEVPEPSAGLLFVLGLGVLVVARRTHGRSISTRSEASPTRS